MNNSRPGALDANRQGRLHPSQFEQFIVPIALSAVWLLIAMAVLGAEINMWINQLFNGQRILATLLMPAGIVLSLALAVGIGGNQAIDLFTMKVAHIDGPSRKQVVTGGRGARVQRYFVSEEKFLVSGGKRFESLPENTIVRAYYTPRSKTLVGAEALQSVGIA